MGTRWRLPALLLGVGIGLGLGVATCRGQGGQAGSEVRVTLLPSPRATGARSLERALSARRSIREYEARPLSREDIGQLAWACQGVTDPRGLRTAPSAGALYPLELYLATAEGLFHYVPKSHALERLADRDLRPRLCQAALGQECVGEAPAVFVLAGVYERTAARYGAERSPRYVHIEAGHAAQNLLLQAAALDLGAVPVGAFEDDQVAEVLGRPPRERPLYLIPVGHPLRFPR